jgi:hypothetical protein
VADPSDPAAELEAALELAKATDGKKKGEYGDVPYADTKNKKYPVDTEKHIRAAWSYINMPKNQKGYTAAEVDAIKGKIVAAWKDKIDKDGPPSAEKMAADAGAITAESLEAFIAAVDGKTLTKGVYNLGWIACILEEMNCLRQCLTTEAALEGDNSPAPAAAEGLVEGICALLIQQAQEECAELCADMREDAPTPPEIMELAAPVFDLIKAAGGALEKVGKRNSAADTARIQGIHDHSVSLGAECDEENCAGAEKLAKVASIETELVRARRTMAAAVPELQRLVKVTQEQAATLATIETRHAGEIGELKAKVEALAKSAGAPKGAVYRVPKEADDANALEKLGNGGGADDDVMSQEAPADPAARRTWAIARMQKRGLLPAPGGDRPLY